MTSRASASPVPVSAQPVATQPASARPAAAHLAIALGDPAGIGPEVLLKALAWPGILDQTRVTLVGSRAIAQQTYQQLKAQGQTAADPAHFTWIDLPIVAEIVPGQESIASGAASFAALNRAIDLALSLNPAEAAQAVVTAPIAKSAWKAAGHLYPGQTELLAERAGVKDFAMMFLGESPHTGWTLRTLLATAHIPLRQVPTALSPALMDQKLALLLQFLRERCGLEQPRVAIAGLNPHSGERGQLGQEEQDWLDSWLTVARQRFPEAQLDGLTPPDTLWVEPGQCWYGSERELLHSSPRSSSRDSSQARGHDAYLALYHDQGLIPVKLMAFDRAVNATVGLPFIRTSPDHGTAFDIAGQGKASEASMAAAIQWAKKLV